ncbi:response regulator [soil metagenome]
MIDVIIIDDDDIVLLVERKMLQRCGVAKDPISFKEGKIALEFIENNIKNRLLILLDINMPKMNGWEFLTHLENLDLNDEIYVIMVTSSIDQYDKDIAKQYSSVIGFIEKPITTHNCEKIKSMKEICGYFKP